MSQSNEQLEQCFIPAHRDLANNQPPKQIQIAFLNINKLLGSANQLHVRARPETLAPRTCFLQMPIYRLPCFLEEDCLQMEDPHHNRDKDQINSIKILENPENLTLQQYFKSYQLIYDKMRMYSKPNFQLVEPTSRFKPINHLSDFHQKLFKQLYVTEIKNSATHVAINDEFQSNFECGNLGQVYKKLDTLDRQYFLLLQNDVNTHGYTSWFFFKVKSCGKGKAFFHMTNLSKSSYLYKIGWKISIFSVGKYNNNQTKWFKGGKNIQTYSTNFEKRGKDGGNYNCLYFEYQFEQDQSEVYFAMSKPYTYSMLTRQIQKIQAQSQNSESPFSAQLIKSIYSVSCNIIPILILQQKKSNELKRNSKSSQQGGLLQVNQSKIFINEDSEQLVEIQDIHLSKGKKCIIFMGRQHPGEIVGSHFIDSIMKLFTSDSQQTNILLQKYHIIFVPMVNPDGVIHGNSRCNLAGLDLNRQWMKEHTKEVTPQTYFLRKFIWEIQQKIQIQYLIDLHGHSKKMNSFIFCNKTGDLFPSQYLPFLISKIEKRFDFSSCTFSTTSDKKNTLRNQLYEDGMKNCLTVQNSYFGYWQDKNPISYNDVDFLQMSRSLINTLFLLLNEQIQQIEKTKILPDFKFSREQIDRQLKVCKQNIIKKGKKNMQTEDIQSESDPEGDQMKPEQRMKIYQIPDHIIKKKNQQLKKKRGKQKKPKQADKDKQDEIRASQPMRGFKQHVQIQAKNHKSEKKLDPPIPSKKNITQQRFRNYSPKPMLTTSKKFSEKREGAMKSTLLRMDENQSKQEIKDGRQSKLKNRILGAPFNKQQHLQACLIKQRRVQTRIKTEGPEHRGLKYQPSLKLGYDRMKEERLKMILNETLSIIKVDNNGGPIHTLPNEPSNRKKSFANDKNIDRQNAYNLQTQNNLNKSSATMLQLQINSNPNKNGLSIAKQKQKQKQKQQRKLYLNKNFKKQFTKRKRLLSNQEERKKYRRFQNFVENQEKLEKDRNMKESVKIQCNSVFYYFPVL